MSEQATVMRTNLDHKAPMRLEVAAKVAFPMGGMTALILRREAARGRLRVMRIGGRLFTTLAAIEEMKELCQESSEDRASGGGQASPFPTAGSLLERGSSRTTEESVSAQASARVALAD